MYDELDRGVGCGLRERLVRVLGFKEYFFFEMFKLTFIFFFPWFPPLNSNGAQAGRRG
jgi:hypothetical protein